LELYRQLKVRFPEAALEHLPMRAEMLEYQLLALYGLARQFDRKKVRIAEIGTGQGASALALSRAAPRAAIISLAVNPAEAMLAQSYLRQADCRNVAVVLQASWDYWREHPGEQWHMVFVDGDHNQIWRDMAWWNNLAPGGLFLCHDYSPVDSARPSPAVFGTLNAFRERLGRDFDVLLVDETKTGMAGWYRKAGEVWAE